MKDFVGEKREKQLRELLIVLADEIDSRPGARDLAQLAKQYRETLAEIDDICGNKDGENEIGKLLAARKADGKAGAVR